MLTLYIYVFHQLFTLLAACYVSHKIQINFSLQNVDKDNILSLFQLKYRVQKVSSATQSFKKKEHLAFYFWAFQHFFTSFGLRKYCNCAVKLENDHITKATASFTLALRQISRTVTDCCAVRLLWN